MKQMLLAAAGAAAVLAIAGAANAAGPTWNGYYAGVDAGYTHGDGQFTGASGLPSNSLSGASIGAHVGRNWQVNNDWLVGAEADASYIGASGKTDVGIGYLKTHVGFGGDLRGHFGRIFGDNAAYVIVGGTGAQGKASFLGLSEKKTIWGWDAGLGFEHKLSGGSSVRIEWVHTGFENAKSSFIPGLGDQVSLDRFMVGTNWKF